MGACVAVAAFTVEDVVLMSPLDYELDWWARVFQWVVSPILLTCGLFLYQVRSVSFMTLLQILSTVPQNALLVSMQLCIHLL